MAVAELPSVVAPRKALLFQEMLFALQRFWAERGCVLQQPYDVEVGAGTMSPDTFLRVLGPKPVRIAYAQPSRRPADGRYGENPNRLYRHTQFQVILKPPPANVQDLYLQSLEAIGIVLADHDIKFEEDNWEWPVGGAWGVGWQVMMDGQEITQFTYFQQCGGLDLDPISGEITYGLERLAQFLQDVDSIYDIEWAREPETGRVTTYGEIRLAEEEQFSAYSFDYADVTSLWKHLELYEAECLALLQGAKALPEDTEELRVKRFPVLGAYELALKCSHLFNLLDARGAISVTERVGVMGRIRTLIVGVAKAYAGQAQRVDGTCRSAGQQRGRRMADFLFELGLEEVPARMLASGEAELAQRVRGLLERERLLAEDASGRELFDPATAGCAGARRVDAAGRCEEDMVGPPVKAAFKDGVPTAAAHAFAKKAGVEVAALQTVTTPKGEYLAATVKHAGRTAAQILAAELPKEIAGIYWAKSMYWRAGKPERFVRPVQWMLACWTSEWSRCNGPGSTPAA